MLSVRSTDCNMRNIVKTKRIIKAGRPGTKKLQAIYGEHLLSVRYKYDYLNRRKYKTVELLIADEPWSPKADDPYLDRICKVKVAYEETEKQRQVKNFGGRWNRAGGYWELTLGSVIQLGLEKRIID